MYRTHNCGELRLKNLNQEVTLSGWVQKSRDKGFMLWIDLRDRFEHTFQHELGVYLPTTLLATALIDGTITISK